VPGVRRVKKASATSRKVNVRYVKFSPEEMAYDCPPDTSDPRRFPTIGRGPRDWRRFMTFRNGFVRLKPEIRKAFADDAAVNEALRKVIEIREMKPAKRKRSA